MTSPGALARTHAAANQVDPAWSATAFATLLETGAILTGDARSFVLGRVIAGEAEVLTLATHPDHQRKGLARAALAAFCATPGIDRVFLEVAADNAAAITLYRQAGFSEVGQRRGYYRRPNQPAVDALVFARQMRPA